METTTQKAIEVGAKFAHTFSFTQDQVANFSELSGDNNPIHTDAEFAAKTIFGKRIMHGFLGASVFTKIFGSLYYAPGSVYLKQEIKFLKPMFVDTEYEGVVTAKELMEEKNRVVFTCEVFDKNTQEPTIVGEAVLMNKLFFAK